MAFRKEVKVGKEWFQTDSWNWFDEKNVTDVVVPSECSDFRFSKNKNVRSITVSEGIKVIDPNWINYVSALEWIEFRDEMEILSDNCAFPGCKKLVYVVCNPNTPLSQLPSKWKQELSIGVLKYLGDGHTVSDAAYKEVKKYIVGQNKKRELYKIGYRYPFVVKFLIEEKILSEDLYDEMIEACRMDSNVEVLAMLIDGKEKQYPSEKVLDRTAQKFEKEMRQEEKLQDQHSSAYLKSRWSWKKRADGTLALWAYKGEETSVTIPSKVGKIAVSAVRGKVFISNVFERNEWIQCHVNQIYFEEGIAEIGVEEELAGVGALIEYRIPTEIHLPASVTKICRYAFHSEVWNNEKMAWEMGIKNVKLFVPAGSFALRYAEENGIPHEIE